MKRLAVTASLSAAILASLGSAMLGCSASEDSLTGPDDGVDDALRCRRNRSACKPSSGDAGAVSPSDSGTGGTEGGTPASSSPDAGSLPDTGGLEAPPCSSTLSSGLVAAVATAAGGTVICLTSGTYRSSAFSSVTKSSDVIVRPAAGATVTIEGLIINSSSHFRFTGLGGVMKIAGIDVDQIDGDPASTWMTFDHIAFTEAITLRARTTNLHWLIDHSTFMNIAAALWEGRISVRGFRTPGDQGITISNNLFSGGGATHTSDGVQLIDGANGVVIRGNEFTNIIQGSYPEHADPIQLYGATNTVVTGNYFHDNGDGTGGLEDFGTSPSDSSPGTVVTNNVFVSPGIFPWSLCGGSAQNWLIQHNTFKGGGSARIDGQPSGNIVRDNLWVGGGLSLAGGGVSNDHNLNSGQSGVGNLTGTPTFVGGANPTTYAGFALAAGSVGEKASSTGTNMGVIP